MLGELARLEKGLCFGKMGILGKLGKVLLKMDGEREVRILNSLSPMGSPPKRGTREILNAYNTMPWLRAVTNKIARSVASIPWKLYVIREKGKVVKDIKVQQAGIEYRKRYLKNMESEEIKEHPLLDLLNYANNYHVGLIVRQLIQIYLDLVGEAFLLLERNALGLPVMMWVLPPDWIASLPSSQKPFYTISFEAINHEIPEKEIIAIKDPNPLNPYQRGSGIANSLADELETDEYAAKHTKAWFYNRARPDIIISAEGLQREDTLRLEQDWIAKSSGFWQAYKPYFLNKKVDVQTLSQTFENMQLIELRRYERDVIIQVFGIPPEILGILENSNRATIETANNIFTRWVVVPRLELLRASLQAKLVPQFDDKLILDYETPILEDKEYHLEVAKSAPWALKIDEWREMMGRAPLPDGQGEGYMLPFSVYPSRQIFPKTEEPEKEKGESKGNGHKEKQEDPKVVRVVRKADFELVQRILEKLDEELLKGKIYPVYKELIEFFGKRAMRDWGATPEDFDMLRPSIITFMEDKTGEYIKGINQTTREALRKQLVEGIIKGESIPQLAERISMVFSEAKGYRAERIARTETVRASNFGTFEGLIQSKIEKKQWLATRDDRVRDAHFAMDGQVRLIHEPFEAPDGSQAMYPGDFGIAELDVNCRCTVVGFVEFGKSGTKGERFDTEEKRVLEWKRYESDRQSWERKMKFAIQKGFQAQQDIVMEELKK